MLCLTWQQTETLILQIGTVRLRVLLLGDNCRPWMCLGVQSKLMIDDKSGFTGYYRLYTSMIRNYGASAFWALSSSMILYNFGGPSRNSRRRLYLRCLYSANRPFNHVTWALA